MVSSANSCRWISGLSQFPRYPGLISIVSLGLGFSGISGKKTGYGFPFGSCRHDSHPKVSISTIVRIGLVTIWVSFDWPDS
jgi:hypothetical protein